MLSSDLATKGQTEPQFVMGVVFKTSGGDAGKGGVISGTTFAVRAKKIVRNDDCKSDLSID